MAGTISLLNKDGDRLHTIYVGSAPESGKMSMAFQNRAKMAELESGRPAAARTDFGWDSYAAHLGAGALRVLEWELGLVL
jgi:hypothetical protein